MSISQLAGEWSGESLAIIYIICHAANWHIFIHIHSIQPGWNTGDDLVLENLPSKKVLSYKVYLPGLYMGNWKLTKLSLTLWPWPAILLKFQPRSSYISPGHRISSQMPSLMLHGQSQQRPLKTYPMKNMCRCCSNLIQLIDSTFIVTVHISSSGHILSFFTDLRHFKNGRVSNGL